MTAILSTGGSGRERIIRSSVNRLTPVYHRVDSRDPAPAFRPRLASSLAGRRRPSTPSEAHAAPARVVQSGRATGSTGLRRGTINGSAGVNGKAGSSRSGTSKVAASTSREKALAVAR